MSEARCHILRIATISCSIGGLLIALAARDDQWFGQDLSEGHWSVLLTGSLQDTLRRDGAAQTEDVARRMPEGQQDRFNGGVHPMMWSPPERFRGAVDAYLASLPGGDGGGDVYDLDAHVAEIYDQTETRTADVALIRRLIGDGERRRVLEPFCGTGRLLIPLAMDGHTVVGLDRASGMLARAKAKIHALPFEMQGRIALARMDVLSDPWPSDFDLVILGGNCLYELATAEEQAQVIASAAEALRSGGHLFVDNDHMEGQLDRSWSDPPARAHVFPTGTCADGTRMESRWRVIWYDATRRLIRLQRQTQMTLPDGSLVEREMVQQKHPVSYQEVAGWITDRGLTIEHRLGDHEGGPYTDAAPRAIFWARKEGGL